MIEQQKHHTGRNATFKDHANGIKKAPNHKFKSMKGMDPKFLRNQRFAKKYNGTKRSKETAE
ncbi:unnamed protein product [Sphacelaria rigidula]